VTQRAGGTQGAIDEANAAKRPQRFMGFRRVGVLVWNMRFAHVPILNDLQFVEKCDVFNCKVFAPLFSKSG